MDESQIVLQAEIVDYELLGKKLATESDGNASSFYSSLNMVYGEYKKEMAVNPETKENKLKELNALKISEESNLKSRLRAKEELVSQKVKLQDRINDKEKTKLKIRTEGSSGGGSKYISFVIAAIIVVLLALYLFLFYASSAYSAFYGVKDGLGIIHPAVFQEALKRGTGVFGIILLFPVIFLGLGFLIHTSLEDKKYTIISILVAFTLLMDCFIGYKISENIWTNEFNAGLVETTWKFSNIYTDINFYLILALGFVVYIIWGYLFHYVLTSFDSLSPDKLATLEIEHIDKEIADLESEKSQFLIRVDSLENEKLKMEQNIMTYEKKITSIENGLFVVDKEYLKSCISKFTSGWIAYLEFMHKGNSSFKNELILAISPMTDKWWSEEFVNF